VSGARDDHEAPLLGLPVGAGASKDHVKSAASGAEAIEQEAKAQQALGMIVEGTNSSR